MRNKSTIKRMEQNVEELISNFDRYVALFNRLNMFGGPSVYFHYKTLAQLGKYAYPVQALKDETYFDYLYATLASWGLHRMGVGYTKLTEIDGIKNSFLKNEKSIEKIQMLSIEELKVEEIDRVADDIWSIIEHLKVGIGATKIVAGSKALHHLLPNLVPPIDGEYTLKFFYGSRGTALNQGDEIVFKEIYPFFFQIASSCKKNIKRGIENGLMATSKTKILDNAIVGYIKDQS